MAQHALTLKDRGMHGIAVRQEIVRSLLPDSLLPKWKIGARYNGY